MQVLFEKILLLLRKDSLDLCRKFPGIGNPRAGGEDQWAFVSNFSHLVAIFQNLALIHPSFSFNRSHLDTPNRVPDPAQLFFRDRKVGKDCLGRRIVHHKLNRVG
jgi:hypothetical protein